MQPRNVWQALGERSYLTSSWPWRGAAYLGGSVLTGLGTLVGAALVLLLGATLASTVVGVLILPALSLTGLPVAAIERRRLHQVDQEPAHNPHTAPEQAGWWAWCKHRLREQATWREFGYAALLGLVLWPLDVLTLSMLIIAPLALATLPITMALFSRGNGRGDSRDDSVDLAWLFTVHGYPTAFAACALGLVLLPGTAYLVGVAAGAQASTARQLIAPPGQLLGLEITELTRSRVRLVDAFDAERRRIERDLHDGAQQHLVALSMTLGLARLDTPAGRTADLLATAHDQAGRALQEIRDLIHGIYPRVLIDHGLGAAIDDAADHSPVPVELDLHLETRAPAAVESAAYFMVAEALTNIARHSGASRAWIEAGYREGLLVIEIADDGRGGADADAGTGLRGLADRISVLGGRLVLASPPGGPTLLRMEIPCDAPEPARRPG